MENDDKYALENNNNNKNGKIFKPEFKGQKINKNKEFINWKRQMNNIFGKTDKMFNCSKDGIYFYDNKNQSKYHPNYLVRCPKCYNSYCFYCSKHFENIYYFEYCCFKRFLVHKLFINYSDYMECAEESNNSIIILLIPLIPFISFIFIITAFSACLFYKEQKKYNDSDSIYNKHLSCGLNIIIIILINILFAIILSIPYLFLNIILILIILLISLPLQFIPLKIIAGWVNKSIADYIFNCDIC